MSVQKLLLLSILILSLGKIEGVYAQISAETLYVEGFTALAKEDLQEAEIKFRQILILDPQHQVGRIQLIEVLLDLGKWQEALDILYQPETAPSVSRDYFADLKGAQLLFSDIEELNTVLYPVRHGITSAGADYSRARALTNRLIHESIGDKLNGRIHFWHAEAFIETDNLDREDAITGYESYVIASNKLAGKTLGHIAKQKKEELSYVESYRKRARGDIIPFSVWSLAVLTDGERLIDPSDRFVENKTTKLSGAFIDVGIDIKATLYGIKRASSKSSEFFHTWEISGYYSYAKGFGEIYEDNQFGQLEFSREFSWEFYDFGLLVTGFSFLSVGYGIIIYDALGKNIRGFSARIDVTPYFPIVGTFDAPRLALLFGFGIRIPHGLSVEPEETILPLQAGVKGPIKIGLRLWL